MKKLYFWVNDRVWVKEWGNPNTRSSIIYGVPCVDDDDIEEWNRYGAFKVGGGWEHIPLKDFPPPFRAALLILGVS